MLLMASAGAAGGVPICMVDHVLIHAGAAAQEAQERVSRQQSSASCRLSVPTAVEALKHGKCDDREPLAAAFCHAVLKLHHGECSQRQLCT